jgi:hypothetical protein
VEVENRLLVARHLGGIRLAMEHAISATVALGGFDLEIADDEGEEVGGEGCCLCEPSGHRASATGGPAPEFDAAG